MANPRKSFRLGLLTLALAAMLPVLALAAGPDRAPSRFVPDLDRQLVQVVNPLDGSTWAAWTYRNGPETDIALSRRDAEGTWSEVQLLGQDDRESQRQPAVTVDEYGTLYLAYSELGSGRIFVTAHGLDARAWTPPTAVSPLGSQAAAPAAMIAANRKLVVGYLIGDRVNLRELSLLPPVILGVGGNDGPDPVGSSMWPPEVTDDDGMDDKDPLIDSDTIFENVVYTGAVHTRGRPR